jgi:AraC family transcriptional regulator
MRSLMLPRGRFCGELLRRSTIGGLTLTDYAYAPSLDVSAHHHESAYVSLVLEGGYEEALDGRARTCTRGTVTVHPPEERHADRFLAATTRIFTIEIDQRWLDRSRVPHPFLDRPTTIDGGPSAALMLRIHRELTDADDFTAVAVEGLALELSAEVARSTRSAPAPPPWLRRAREIVADRSARRLTLSEIAKEAGVHPMHLAREYRSHYGMSVGAAIRAHRVEAAAVRLATTADPIARIALDIGFSHQSHFTVAFKRLTGMTPAAFRKRYACARAAKFTLRSR